MGYFIDPRDGQKYRTVQIGDYEWMAENLRYNIDGSWCYDDDESNCQKYGRLYNWETAKKACPEGWHLPTEYEWEVLYNKASCDCANLKAKVGWTREADAPYTDSFGFSALPSGDRGSDGSFSGGGTGCEWWTAVEFDEKILAKRKSLAEGFAEGLFPGINTDTAALSVGMWSDWSELNLDYIKRKNCGCSVRCVRKFGMNISDENQIMAQEQFELYKREKQRVSMIHSDLDVQRLRYTDIYGYLKNAAELGHIDAQLELGKWWKNGNLLHNKSYEKALRWFTDAADQGSVDAQWETGEFYWNGYGVPKDEEKAVFWYTQAAEHGCVVAMKKLADCYKNGCEGIPKDMEKAVSWYAKAVDQGDNSARYALGVCYYNGDGIPKDVAYAKELIAVAANLGCDDAKKALERLTADKPLEKTEDEKKQEAEEQKLKLEEKRRETEELKLKQKKHREKMRPWDALSIVLGGLIGGLLAFGVFNEGFKDVENSGYVWILCGIAVLCICLSVIGGARGCTWGCGLLVGGGGLLFALAYSIKVMPVAAIFIGVVFGLLIGKTVAVTIGEHLWKKKHGESQ